jgi:GT2 family glycosyltransferase
VSRVVVVIPTWNGRELLDAALSSLARQSLAAAEVIVVDNGSTDGTTAHVKEHWPAASLVALEGNRGFAAAVNAGVAASSSEYVALLNNDMELDPEWLASLVAALDGDPGAGSAASKLRMLREPELLDGAGDLVTWYGATWRRGHGEPDRGQYDDPGVVASPCAGAALYRRQALEQVGGFDERFFLYCEDKDLCRRIRAAAYDVCYEPQATVRHRGGASAPRARLLPVLARSRVEYARKHCGGLRAVLERAGVALNELTHAVVSRGGREQRAGHLSALAAALGRADRHRP